MNYFERILTNLFLASFVSLTFYFAFASFAPDRNLPLRMWYAIVIGAWILSVLIGRLID